MELKRPLILISNDDGYLAKGINELIDYLRPLGEIVVVAPDSARTGSGCAITVTQPVHYDLVRKDVGLSIYKCSGTPTDCVKLSLFTILNGRKPDIIVSGINHGDNSATNVHNSGTMGVVIEGCLNDIPSVGFSICSHNPDVDFIHTKPFIFKIVDEILKKGLPMQTCLNVNFPNDEIKGIKVCTQARGYWTQEWESCPRKGDENYFWLTGTFIDADSNDEKTDRWALHHNYAAITPIQIDLTGYKFMNELNSWFK